MMDKELMANVQALTKTIRRQNYITAISELHKLDCMDDIEYAANLCNVIEADGFKVPDKWRKQIG